VTLSYVVDAHHHLWDLAAVEYPWLNQRGVRRFFGDPTPIQRDYGVADLRADHGAIDVRKSVHIQVGVADGAEIDETEWLEKQADAQGLPSALVAFCDLSRARAPDVLQAHLERSRRLRGVRQIFSRHPDEDAANGSPGLLTDRTVAENLKLLSALDLSFDLQLTPPHMKAAAKLLGSIDGLKVALCHAGSPWRRDPDGFAEWRSGLQALAEVPGLVCKLSGLGMFDPDWTEESLTPVILTALEIFGPDRVMWGSNFPVDKLYRSYGELVSAITAIVPQTTHEQLFRTTAESFYRI
jgi:predicted TIM-barrel fold metal-dependent hydrolase